MKLNNKFLIPITIILILLVIIIIIVATTDTSEEESEIYINNYLKDIGYTYDDETDMYKKITTNNTLDDYYAYSKNNQDVLYQEYYYALDTNTFIELNMAYSNGTTEVYNIQSDLVNDKITYNYEITKNDSSAIIEGEYNENNDNSFTCNTVSLKKLKSDGIPTYCETAETLTKLFLEEENSLLSNQEFKEKVNVKHKEIVIKD